LSLNDSQQQGATFTLDNGQTFHQLPPQYQIYAPIFQRNTNGVSSDENVSQQLVIFLTHAKNSVESFEHKLNLTFNRSYSRFLKEQRTFVDDNE
jgi:hypothetical protein